MFDAVDLYHDVLRSWKGVVPVIEKPVPCKVIHPDMPDGTPDAWAYDPTTRTLYIADLKYGFKFVEVWYNWQLLCYVMALLELLGLNGSHDEYITVDATIIQPRSNHRDGPVRNWRVRVSELRGHFNELIYKAQVAMQPEAPCVVNPGCGDCPARHACVTLQQSALGALEQSYAGIPLELSPAAIGDELRRLKEGAKRMEARITGLEVQAESLIRNGQVIPGWGLSPTFARERWREGVEAQVIATGMYFGNVDLAQPRKPISPARARKLLPQGVVEMFSHKPSTGVRLTKADPYEALKKFQSKPE
jgi:hypothetical protein